MFSQREFGLWFKVHFGNLANEQKLNKKGNVGGVLFVYCPPQAKKIFWGVVARSWDFAGFQYQF